jgi:GIY-YIG catalytic domain
MLLGIYLLKPVTMYNFEQSAGNQPTLFLQNNVLVGTSETIRGPRSLLREDIVRVIKSSLIPLKISIIFFTKYRFYSNLTNHFDLDNNIINLKPVKVYILKIDRLQTLKNEKDKSRVYCFINQINGHVYVGSSINLASRIINYLNNTFLKSKQNKNMPIIRALLKYDQSKFTLLILEYVEVESLTIR